MPEFAGSQVKFFLVYTGKHSKGALTFPSVNIGRELVSILHGTYLLSFRVPVNIYATKKQKWNMWRDQRLFSSFREEQCMTLSLRRGRPSTKGSRRTPVSLINASNRQIRHNYSQINRSNSQITRLIDIYQIYRTTCTVFLCLM